MNNQLSEPDRKLLIIAVTLITLATTGAVMWMAYEMPETRQIIAGAFVSTPAFGAVGLFMLLGYSRNPTSANVVNTEPSPTTINNPPPTQPTAPTAPNAAAPTQASTANPARPNTPGVTSA